MIFVSSMPNTAVVKMGYPRSATSELIAEIERVCRMRLAAKTILSDRQLARKHNVSERVVSRWMLRV